MEQLKASLANVDSNGNVAAPIFRHHSLLIGGGKWVRLPSAPVATIDSTTDMGGKRYRGIGVSDWGKLQVGGRVSVSIPRRGGQWEFQGTISALEKSADATTHLYGVTIQSAIGLFQRIAVRHVC